MPRILVSVYGGVVQGITAEQPLPPGWEVWVADHDDDSDRKVSGGGQEVVVAPAVIAQEIASIEEDCDYCDATGEADPDPADEYRTPRPCPECQGQGVWHPFVA